MHFYAFYNVKEVQIVQKIAKDPVGNWIEQNIVSVQILKEKN